MRTLLTSLILMGLANSTAIAEEPAQQKYLVFTSCNCEYIEDSALIKNLDAFGASETYYDCTGEDAMKIVTCAAEKLKSETSAKVDCMKKAKMINVVTNGCSTEVLKY